MLDVSQPRQGAIKFHVFARIVSFAAETRQAELLLPYLGTAGSWASAWGVPEAELRGLYLAISKALSSVSAPEAAQAFLIRYLATFEGAEPAELTEARSAVCLVVCPFLCLRKEGRGY
jgi:hypothetical protein